MKKLAHIIFLTMAGMTMAIQVFAKPVINHNLIKHSVMAPDTKSIQKEMVFPHSRDQVWKAITDSKILGEWIYPNDFLPKVGHKFTFHVPGIDVHCQVLECDPT